jgi:hypothetical protein
MPDVFDDHSDLESPATAAFAITKSDTTVFDQPTRALWVGTAGHLTLQFKDAQVVQLKNVPQGCLLPVRVTKVLEATTASDIVGLY